MKKFSTALIIFVGIGLISMAWTLKSASAEEEARYTGNENHNITLMEAQEMIHQFQMENPGQDIKGGYFGKAAFMRVLNQDDAVGIRYYFGINEKGQPNLVLVGVDKHGNDMVEGELAERALPCPTYCDGVRLDQYVAPEAKISQR